MAVWQVQDAMARFSEFLEAAIENGPQIVTRRGIETAVLLSIEEWRRLQEAAHRNLKDPLLAPEPRVNDLVSSKRNVRRRPPVEFEP